MNFWFDRVMFAIVSAGAFAIGELFAYGASRDFYGGRWFLGGAAAVFIVLGIMGCYRACGPDEWFAERDRKQREWTARHPFIAIVLIGFSAVCFVWEILEYLLGRELP